MEWESTNLTWDDLRPEVLERIEKTFKEPMREIDEEFRRRFYIQIDFEMPLRHNPIKGG